MADIMQSDVSAKAPWVFMRGDDVLFELKFPEDFDMDGIELFVQAKQIGGGTGDLDLQATIEKDNVTKLATITIPGSATAELKPTGAAGPNYTGNVKYAYSIHMVQEELKTTLLCGPLHINAYEY